MIERLVTTLRALAALPATELRTQAGERLVADCADALRLALDCPQQDLTPAQRRVLRRLGDVLDEPLPSLGARDEVPRAARAACLAIGLAVHRETDERRQDVTNPG